MAKYNPKKDPPKDSEKFKNEEDKFKKYFKEKPLKRKNQIKLLRKKVKL